MKNPARNVAGIVEHASTLYERVHEIFTPSETDKHNVDVMSSRLERWRETAANNDHHEFLRRLTKDNIQFDQLQNILGPSCLAQTNWMIRSWVPILHEVFRLLRPSASTNTWRKNIDNDRCLDVASTIPFEEVLLAFVLIARSNLLGIGGSKCKLLTETAHINLERHLLRQLSYISGKVLLLEFSLFRVHRQPNILLNLNSPVSVKSRKDYVAFVNALLDGRLLSIMKEYSVMSRLLAQATAQWIEASSAFLNQLHSDIHAISKTFFASRNVGRVSAISLGLSDRHQQGKTVFRVEFESGEKLIYKPRDVSVEYAFGALVDWFNNSRNPLKLKFPKVLNCLTHGWVEFIEHQPCSDEKAVENYYQRMGMVLCLLYALNGKDFHFENLIANGEYPVPIDMEMLLAPHWANPERQDAITLTSRKVDQSVINIGILPVWDTLSNGQLVDISSLGLRRDIEPKTIQETWISINTDRMSLLEVEGSASTSRDQCAVILEGEIISPRAYLNYLIEGFRIAYLNLLARKDVLVAKDGPLTAFKNVRTRFIFRRTRFYYRLLKLSLQPCFLKEGIDRSIEIEALNQAAMGGNSQHLRWPIVQSEINALERMDIPVFATYSSKTSLGTEGETIEEYFQSTGYEQTLNKILALSETDLETQVSFIRCMLYAPFAHAHSAKGGNTHEWEYSDPNPLSDEELIDEACAIGDLLEKSAFTLNGSTSWIALSYRWQTQHYDLRPISFDLYGGSAGIGIFLAALATITQDERYLSIALATLKPVREAFFVSPNTLNLVNIGGAVGIGSAIYGLTRSGLFLQNSEFLDDACAIVEMINEAHISSDLNYDVLSGTAGAILGLLALYRATADDSVLEKAISCGVHLLKTRSATLAGYHSWRTVNDKFLTGFSHGASGIAYALLMLYKESSDPRFYEAAKEAIQYERSVFSVEAANWPDFRDFEEGTQSELPFMTSWCHGATGIGMARLGGLSVFDDPFVREEIFTALETTINFGVEDRDHLCCGNFGRIDFLHTAGQSLFIPHLVEVARLRTTQVVRRAHQSNGYHMFADLHPTEYKPGLFQGLSGIGYTLIRLAFPNKFPSLLLWE